MIATWSPFVARCRSRQETEAFSTPSSNHLMVTSPVKSTFLIFVGAFIQATRLASCFQKASGCEAASSVIACHLAALTCALAAISGFTPMSSSDMPGPSPCLLATV